MDAILSSKSKRIPELDGLRAFAVILVVIYHMSDFAASLPRGPYWIATIVTSLGPNGVNVFFIISGFIITTLLMREKISAGQVSLAAFYIRRFFRIVPPFGTYLLALLAIRALGGISISSHNLLWSALFLGDIVFINPMNGWFVAHTWSLSVEEQFYLIFPPLLFLVGRSRKRITVAILCALYGLCLVSLKLAHEFSLHNAPQLNGISALYHFRYIIIGVVLAIHGDLVLPLLTNKSRIWPLVFAMIVISLQLVTFGSNLLSVLFAAMDPCFCGLFVMWFMQNPSRCGLLRSPAIQWIGASSYSIYLWQQLFTAPRSNYSGWALTLTPTPLSVLAIGICAAGSYYFVERPSIRLGRYLSRRSRVTQSNSEISEQEAA